MRRCGWSVGGGGKGGVWVEWQWQHGTTANGHTLVHPLLHLMPRVTHTSLTAYIAATEPSRVEDAGGSEWLVLGMGLSGRA